MSLFLETALPSTCPDPVASAAAFQDCSFYPSCLETTFECGPESYPIGYGDKYCNRFLDSIDMFSPEGQDWINGTLTCLKGALVPDVQDPTGVTCDDVETTAFDSHVQCYIDNGFCDLAFNYGHPFEMSDFIYDLMHVYQIKDFASFIVLKQIATVFAKCNFSNLTTTEW